MAIAYRNTLAWRELGGWLWMAGLLFLPVIFDPLRMESYESPRATLSVVLGVGIALSALAAWQTLSNSERHALVRNPLILAVAIWAASITVSAILSLSPSRSILGDLERRMGLLTQWSLVAAFVGGHLITRRQRGLCWPLLAVVSLLVTGHGFLDRLSLSLRPPSTFGNTTFAAGWAVLVILLIGGALGANTDRRSPRNLLYVISLTALAIFVVITQTRSAALGLLIGLLTLGFAWLLTHRRTKLGIAALCAVVGLLMTGIALYAGLIKIDWSTSVLFNVPLVRRLDATNDTSSQFRLELWRSASHIVTDWPAVPATNGRVDPLVSIRPLVGYGQEMFEFVERPYVTDKLRTLYQATEFLDRAHNLWLDVLVTQGVLGLVSLAAVYLTGILLCLRVLRQQRNKWGERGWIAAVALAILLAHAVDLQFNFPTTASEWPFWATLGIMSQVTQEPASTHPWPGSKAAWQRSLLLPLLAWGLAWSLAAQSNLVQVPPGSLFLPFGLLLFARSRRNLVMVALAALAAMTIRRNLVGLAQTTLGNSQIGAAQALLLADHSIYLLGLAGILIALLWYLRRTLTRTPAMIRITVVALATASVWWVCDASADSMFLFASSQPGLTRANAYLAALQFKTPDDRLLHLTGSTWLLLSEGQPKNDSPEWYSLGCAFIFHGQSLNLYDTNLIGEIAQCTHLP